MDWRSLPPLSALRAFSAFAENGNVVDAGDALGVSHAAISQQLRVLESHMDVALLDRTGRALRLTAQGALLAQALKGGFSQISDGVGALTGSRNAGPLHMSMTPTFAASWLMPRLSGFRAAYPEIDLMIDPTVKVVTLETGGIDVAIRYGKGSWEGADATLLWESPMVVVGAPVLVGEISYGDTNAMSQLPWIEEMGSSEASNWRKRSALAQSGTATLNLPGNLLLDAARNGLGIAVAVRRFVQGDIDAGRLQVLNEDPSRGTGYYIVTRTGVMRPPLKAFVSWLKREGPLA